MRTTVSLDDGVRKALDEFRRERGLGTSSALNELVRRGLAASQAPKITPFQQRSSSIGTPRIPLDDIGQVLEIIEGDAHR